MSSFLNNYLFIVLAILAGMAMPTQAVVNSRLAATVDSPLIAAFVSFFIGTAAIFVYILLTGVPLNNLFSVRNAPPIALVGGLLGAFFVSVMATIIPRVPVALAFSLAIAGQMIVTLLVDHFGWLGVEVKPINPVRVLGAILVTVGVILIRKF